MKVIFFLNFQNLFFNRTTKVYRKSMLTQSQINFSES